MKQRSTNSPPPSLQDFATYPGPPASHHSSYPRQASQLPRLYSQPPVPASAYSPHYRPCSALHAMRYAGAPPPGAYSACGTTPRPSDTRPPGITRAPVAEQASSLPSGTAPQAAGSATTITRATGHSKSLKVALQKIFHKDAGKAELFLFSFELFMLS